MSYISEIHTLNVRNIPLIKAVLFELGESHRHLLITGKNGTGKTTLLNAIRDEVSLLRTYKNAINHHRSSYVGLHSQLQSAVSEEAKSGILFQIKQLNPKLCVQEVYLGRYNSADTYFKNTLFIFFDSRRLTNPSVPTGPIKVDLNKSDSDKPVASKKFLQYLVNLWTEKAYAREDGDQARVNEINEWFETFRLNLGRLFEDGSLKLDYDRKEYNFYIKQNGKEPFSLNELSDGLSSALNIVSELIMRMEELNESGMPLGHVPGIVLIDEIETHLHVSLQKLILPLLVELFPKIQFIVTTHSPFVLTSLSNACILDLSSKELFSDFSSYSYEAVVEEFFGVNKYSFQLKDKIKDVERLIFANDLSGAEAALIEIDEVAVLTPFFKDNSQELGMKISELKLAIKHAGESS